jgi:hypothetical protein
MVIAQTPADQTSDLRRDLGCCRAVLGPRSNSRCNVLSRICPAKFPRVHLQGQSRDYPGCSTRACAGGARLDSHELGVEIACCTACTRSILRLREPEQWCKVKPSDNRSCVAVSVRSSDIPFIDLVISWARPVRGSPSSLSISAAVLLPALTYQSSSQERDGSVETTKHFAEMPVAFRAWANITWHRQANRDNK